MRVDPRPRILGGFVESQELGEVWAAPMDVVLSNVDVVQPDLLFLSRSRLHLLNDAHLRGAPDLVVEILSPSTRRTDAFDKPHSVEPGPGEQTPVPAGSQIAQQPESALTVPSFGLCTVSEAKSQHVRMDLAEILQDLDDRNRHLRVVRVVPGALRHLPVSDLMQDIFRRPEEPLAKGVSHGETIQ